jgi:hypothetical protein
MKTKIQMDAVSFRGNTEGGNHRNLSVGPCALIQNRRLSPGRPAPSHQRRHQHATFINKNQEGLQA